MHCDCDCECDIEHVYKNNESSVFTARCTIVQSTVCLSVHLSVTLVVVVVDHDHNHHIGWKSWKLIARTISLTPSLFVAQRTGTYAEGNMGKFVETIGGVGKKWRSGAQKRQTGNISETRKEREKVNMEGL